MSNTLNSQNFAKDQSMTKTVAPWNHGKLMPIEKHYWAWKNKDTGEAAKEVTEAEFEKLDQNARGIIYDFQIDGSVLNPKLQYPYRQSAGVGFPDWNNILVPSILNVVGEGAKSIGIFGDRAEAGTWYVEAEVVPTGVRNDRQQYTFRFTRMTQNLDELYAWNKEKYPKKGLPEEVVNQLKVYWKMAKHNLDLFLTVVSQDEDTVQYLGEAKAMDKSSWE